MTKMHSELCLWRNASGIFLNAQRRFRELTLLRWPTAMLLWKLFEQGDVETEDVCCFGERFKLRRRRTFLVTLIDCPELQRLFVVRRKRDCVGKKSAYALLVVEESTPALWVLGLETRYRLRLCFRSWPFLKILRGFFNRYPFCVHSSLFISTPLPTILNDVSRF